MPHSTGVSSNTKVMDDKKTLANKPEKTQAVNSSQDDKKPEADEVSTVVGRPAKEIESAGVDEQMSQIKELSKEADVAAEKEVRAAIGEEARLSLEEPKIGPDLEDHGVFSPEIQASNALKKGVLELPMTEEEFESARKAKVGGKSDEKDSVLGVSSIVALAMWVGRVIKMAHGHALRIVFRKPSFAKATEGKEDGE